MNGKRFSENKARRNGFYLALAVCLVAVGIAAWSTFDAVQGYIAANNETASTPETSSGTTSPSDDPEAPRSPAPRTPAPSAKPYAAVRPSEPPAATPKPSAAATPAPSAAPQAQAESGQSEEEPQVPANAPLYEISGEMIYPVRGTGHDPAADPPERHGDLQSLQRGRAGLLQHHEGLAGSRGHGPLRRERRGGAGLWERHREGDLYGPYAGQCGGD